MFTIENLKKAGTTFIVVLLALAAHQKFVAPKLAPKAPVKL